MNAFRSTLLASAMLSSLAANAGDLGEARQVTVSYADLDLKTTADVQRLYQRIDTAAAFVCRDLDTKDLSGRHVWKQCLNDAVARAVLDVNAPLLTVHYEAKNSKTPEQVALAASE
jgi:UrcA family protein